MEEQKASFADWGRRNSESEREAFSYMRMFGASLPFKRTNHFNGYANEFELLLFNKILQ